MRRLIILTGHQVIPVARVPHQVLAGVAQALVVPVRLAGVRPQALRAVRVRPVAEVALLQAPRLLHGAQVLRL